jgi:uncharacterized protein YecE (DUF72 family)
MKKKPGAIRVGIGGWNYEPWRETFYPKEIKPADELHYASRQVTTIEINSTFYRLQKPAVFAKWRDATPDDFIFSVKAPRFVTQRKLLAEAGDAITRFVESGIAELRTKLGPLLWQLPPTHAFDAEDMAAFLAQLPKKTGNIPLRHALNVRHESFRTAEFVELAREHEVAVVFEDDDEYPAIADVTTSFVYARLRRSVASQPTGYSKRALQEWAERARAWAAGEHPEDLARVAPTGNTPTANRDVFVLFINGAKERAPAAARQLIENLD